jgi:hypothetical protein
MTHADFIDLIHIQFQEKKQAVHSNYIAEHLQFFNVSYTYVAGDCKDLNCTRNLCG